MSAGGSQRQVGPTCQCREKEKEKENAHRRAESLHGLLFLLGLLGRTRPILLSSFSFSSHPAESRKGQRRSGSAPSARTPARRRYGQAMAVVCSTEAGKSLDPGSRVRAHTWRTAGKAMAGLWRRSVARPVASAAAPWHASGANRRGPIQGEQECRPGGLAVATRMRAGIGFTRATMWPGARHVGARTGERRFAR